mmetsp:Transcript_35471/g.80038  ORF Transcript_35471/g.80038 Transcript_35471/m.80038 type:complete len:366 (+) Transcript_35471:1666-2763(+)
MRLCRPNFCSLAASLLLSLPGASPFSASRRQVFSAGAGLLSSRLFKPLDADAVINGASVSKAEAAAAGAVGLWIDLANCTVCRHDVPAACSGTLISEDLVLSAKHCLDIPEELNGTLSRVVFSNSLFDKAAESSPVAAFRKTSDYSFAAAGPSAGSSGSSSEIGGASGDLVLIKLAKPAPKNWRPQSLSFNFVESMEEGFADLSSGASSGVPGNAKASAGKGAPSGSLTDVIGFPELTIYGFGDTEDDYYSYSSGALKSLRVRVVSTIGPKARGFYTSPPDEGTGACNGDSGAAGLLGSGQGRVVVGVLSSTSTPCTGSTSAFVNPDVFRAFVEKASADLGAPVKVRTKSEWRDFLFGKYVYPGI